MANLKSFLPHASRRDGKGTGSRFAVVSGQFCTTRIGPMTRRINFASQMKTSGQCSWMTSGDLAVQKLTVTPWVASGLLTHQLKTPPNLSGFFRDCRATADSCSALASFRMGMDSWAGASLGV